MNMDWPELSKLIAGGLITLTLGIPAVWLEERIRKNRRQRGLEARKAELEVQKLERELSVPGAAAPEAAAPRFNVQIQGSVQGAVIGDQAHVVQNFSAPPPAPGGSPTAEQAHPTARANQRTQKALRSEDVDQEMHGRGGVQRQEAVDSKRVKQKMD